MRRPGLPPASKSVFEALALDVDTLTAFKAGQKANGVSHLLAVNTGLHKPARKEHEGQPHQQQMSKTVQSPFASQVLFSALAIDGAALTVLKRKRSGAKTRQKMPLLSESERRAVQALPVMPAIRELAEQPMTELPSPNEQVEQPTPELPSLDEQASPVMPAREISKQALPAALSRDTSFQDSSYQDSSSCGSSASVASDCGQDGEVPGAGPELASILRLRHALTEKRPLRQCSFDDVDFDGSNCSFGGATGCGFGAVAGERHGADGYPETEVQPPKKLQPFSQKSMSARLSAKMKAQSCCHGGA